MPESFRCLHDAGRGWAGSISIRQNDCNRIAIVRNTGYLGTTTSEKHVLRLDGKEQADTAWFGGLKRHRTAAGFVGHELLVNTKAVGDIAITIIYSLNSDRDLQEAVDAGRGRGLPVVATRKR